MKKLAPKISAVAVAAMASQIQARSADQQIGVAMHEAQRREELRQAMPTLVPEDGPNYRKRVATLLATAVALPILNDLERLLKDVAEAERRGALFKEYHDAMKNRVAVSLAENSSAEDIQAGIERMKKAEAAVEGL